MIARLLARRTARRHAQRQSAIDLDITLAEYNARTGAQVHACWVAPSRATVLAAVTSAGHLGASEPLLPGAAKRITDAVMATFPPDPVRDVLRVDLAADPGLVGDYARRFAGEEYGDMPAMRDGMGQRQDAPRDGQVGA